jgi:pyruvate dehydrogenase E1 component alpha subunit
MASVKEKSKANVNSSGKFSKETYLFWYEKMVLLRKFEEKADNYTDNRK